MYVIFEDYHSKIFVAEFKTMREAKKFLRENDYHPDAEVWIEKVEK